MTMTLTQALRDELYDGLKEMIAADRQTEGAAGYLAVLCRTPVGTELAEDHELMDPIELFGLNPDDEAPAPAVRPAFKTVTVAG